VPPAVVSDYVEVSGGAMMMEYERERESHNRRATETRLKREDVSWSMLETVGDPGTALRNAAELADIIVVSGPAASDGEFRRIVGEVAVKSGRLVLAVPPAATGLDAGGSALVGWNGSHEASEALRQAIPLLQRAAVVTLLDIDHPAGDVSINEAASYLSRHGVHPRVVTRVSHEKSISEVILEEAHAMGAAYVVIGAYGLPRSFEAIFGGVTADLLQESDLPIVLAH
jgi:nucleotide-binding universal stress UspA family protein